MFTNVDDYRDVNYKVKWGLKHMCKEIYPLNLNITNSVELAKRLQPLIYSVLSNLEKIKNTVGENRPYNPDDIIEINACFVCNLPLRGVYYPFCGEQKIFDIQINFSNLEKRKILRSIKIKIKNKMEENYFHLAFSTKPINIIVEYQIFRPKREWHAARIQYNIYNRMRMWEEEEEEKRRRQIINKSNTYTSNECVICLTNPPKVLFCSCGHISMCEECDDVKNLETCPICKTKSTIKRVI